MKSIILLLSCVLMLSGCGYYGQAKREAIAHFNRNHAAIEQFANFYRTNSGVSYVEFRAGNCIDLQVLDRDASSTGVKTFKYDLSGASIDSGMVSNALIYASVSQETLVALRNLAIRAGCISIEKARSDSAVDIEIGFVRVNMSIYIYRKFKDSENVTTLVSRPPWRDDVLALLTGQWVLVVGAPAFN